MTKPRKPPQPASTNEEARKRHVKLPSKHRGKRHFRRGRGTSLADQKYSRRKKASLVKTLQSIKLERGCESGNCPVQGELYPQDLAFHHCVGTKKAALTEISSLPSALKEIEKCLVLCHICHSRVHNGQIDISQVIQSKWPNYTPDDDQPDIKQRPQKWLFD